jgi:ATP-dependent Clp protease adapter protein ClpS
LASDINEQKSKVANTGNAHEPKKYTVLVVEDNLLNQKIVVRMLASLGNSQESEKC